MSTLRIFLIILATIFVPANCWAGHPNHMSLSEVQWNSESGKLEISLCLWPADLERAIAQMRDRPTNLDTVSNLDSILKDYVTQHFVVTCSKKLTHKICWVGSEINAKQAWLYFEVDGHQFGDLVTIGSTVLFEINSDQMNHVQFKSNSVCQYRMATLDNPHMEFEIPGH